MKYKLFFDVEVYIDIDDQGIICVKRIFDGIIFGKCFIEFLRILNFNLEVCDGVNLLNFVIIFVCLVFIND